MRGHARAIAAEALGTGLLLAVIVGSGITGERLAGGNAAIALLANSLATGLGLAALILAFAPLSGAHFNPLITLVAAFQGKLVWRLVPAYVLAQLIGALIGVAAAHAMFEHALFTLSDHARTGPAQAWSEAVATFGLVIVIGRCGRHGVKSVAAAVSAYVAAAYWFTGSTSFANPVVTVARALTDTFSGIRIADVPAFTFAQFLGAAMSAWVMLWLDAAPSLAGEPQPGRPSPKQLIP